MRRIIVLGCGGAGKSTFARRLGDALNIEVIHLDAYYWKSGWIEPPAEEWRQTVDALLQREAWIMDGNYGGTLVRRAESCDTIIFLDRSRWLCLWRILKRRVKYRNDVRPDMAHGCREKIDLEFLTWIWRYGNHTRPKILSVIESASPDKRIIFLRSDEEVEAFIDAVAI